MTALDDILSEASQARLIPTLHQSRQEQRLVSVFLATMSVVRPLAVQVLRPLNAPITSTSDLRSYTEVDFPSRDGGSADRPDGVVTVTRGKTRWAALVEAKIGNATIDVEQIRRYARIAIENGLNAVVTVSNELVAIPSHVPYTPIAKKFKRVEFYHLSWMNVLTKAKLILDDKERMSRADKREKDPEQMYILGEMVEYLEHEKSGVRRLVRMNKGWAELVRGVSRGTSFRADSPEIEETVGTWHQEIRDICLALRRRIDGEVDVHIQPKHRTDPELRLRDARERLTSSSELRCAFIVPNAASPMEVVVDLRARRCSCSMKLKAPRDRPTAKGRIGWLLRQLNAPKRRAMAEASGLREEDVVVRVYWPRASIAKTLAQINADRGCLERDAPSSLPSRFEVLMARHDSRRFASSGAFVDDLEGLVPEFYEKVGQHLRQWVPSAPPIDQGVSSTEADPGDTDRGG